MRETKKQRFLAIPKDSEWPTQATTTVQENNNIGATCPQMRGQCLKHPEIVRFHLDLHPIS